MEHLERVRTQALALGANRAEIVSVSDITFCPEFRLLCEQNACGKYGKNWMCPPHAGEIHDLIRKAKGYTRAVVYQTVGALEDSFDYEGMQACGQNHSRLAQQLQAFLQAEEYGPYLHLGAGSCRLCERCAVLDDNPCVFPDRALPSIDAYGINVSELARLAGMNYVNGQNTVTYFGSVLF